MWRSGGIMLAGNTELLKGKSVLPTQVQFIFLGFSSGGCCGQTGDKDKSSTK
jgi:hypothetical protein